MTIFKTNTALVATVVSAMLIIGCQGNTNRTEMKDERHRKSDKDEAFVNREKILEKEKEYYLAHMHEIKMISSICEVIFHKYNYESISIKHEVSDHVIHFALNSIGFSPNTVYTNYDLNDADYRILACISEENGKFDSSVRHEKILNESSLHQLFDLYKRISPDGVGVVKQGVFLSLGPPIFRSESFRSGIILLFPGQAISGSKYHKIDENVYIGDSRL